MEEHDIKDCDPSTCEQHRTADVSAAICKEAEDVAALVESADGKTTLEELRNVFREHLYLPDAAVVDFTLGMAVANRLPGDPVWGFVVGPPSSGKTEALQALDGLPWAHMMSTLTDNTLLSGKRPPKNGPDPSLLKRIPDGTLLILKDFGTVLSLRDEPRAAILSQLREVFDGSLVKETGLGTLSWKGHLGFVAGTTPVVDIHHSVISLLGERFLYFRVPEADRERVSNRVLQAFDDSSMREELQAAVVRFMDGLVIPDSRQELPADVAVRLVNLAHLCTWARSAVHRDRFSREIEVAPSREAPGRFVKQLATLYRALGVMGHEDPLGLVTRVAMDSMPPARSAMLKLAGIRGVCTTTELRKAARLSSSAGRRCAEDLEALELFDKIEDGQAATEGQKGKAATWGLSPEGSRAWLRALDIPLPVDPQSAPAITGDGGTGNRRGEEVFAGALGDLSYLADLTLVEDQGDAQEESAVI